MAFRNRAADKARRAASGGDGPPAGQDPQVPGEPATPVVADRGAMRKRLRRTRRARDVVLHELGALVMEMHRQNRHDPALVERKAREAIAVDSEARALSGALGRDETLSTLQEAGIAGPCASCGALLTRDDRYCNRCGAAAAFAAGAAPAGAGIAAPPPTGAPLAGPPPSVSPVEGPPPTGAPLAGPPPTGSPVEGPPPTGSPVAGPPADDPSPNRSLLDDPAGADPSSAPPPTGKPLDGPPPASGDDGVPTYRVKTR